MVIAGEMERLLSTIPGKAPGAVHPEGIPQMLI